MSEIDPREPLADALLGLTLLEAFSFGDPDRLIPWVSEDPGDEARNAIAAALSIITSGLIGGYSTTLAVRLMSDRAAAELKLADAIPNGVEHQASLAVASYCLGLRPSAETDQVIVFLHSASRHGGHASIKELLTSIRSKLIGLMARTDNA